MATSAKNQKYGSFEKHFPPKRLFGYLATFGSFSIFYVPQFLLGEQR